jgi:hypothetical protein
MSGVPRWEREAPGNICHLRAGLLFSSLGPITVRVLMRGWGRSGRPIPRALGLARSLPARRHPSIKTRITMSIRKPKRRCTSHWRQESCETKVGGLGQEFSELLKIIPKIFRTSKNFSPSSTT